jgi:hypothetical protein
MAGAGSGRRDRTLIATSTADRFVLVERADFSVRHELGQAVRFHAETADGPPPLANCTRQRALQPPYPVGSAAVWLNASELALRGGTK